MKTTPTTIAPFIYPILVELRRLLPQHLRVELHQDPFYRPESANRAYIHLPFVEVKSEVKDVVDLILETRGVPDPGPVIFKLVQNRKHEPFGGPQKVTSFDLHATCAADATSQEIEAQITRIAESLSALEPVNPFLIRVAGTTLQDWEAQRRSPLLKAFRSRRSAFPRAFRVFR